MRTWAKRRRERIERRRRGPLPETPPSPEALSIMEYRMDMHDQMPPAWRALVHYFGFEKVIHLYDGNYDPVMAWHVLDAQREAAQWR